MSKTKVNDDLRSLILGIADMPEPSPIEVPEWNCTLFIKVMSAGERMAFETLMSDYPKNVRECIVVMTVCNESGSLVFNEGDVSALASKNGAIIDRLVKASLSLNKFNADDVDTLQKK